jgi:hypothetical protein
MLGTAPFRELVDEFVVVGARVTPLVQVFGRYASATGEVMVGIFGWMVLGEAKTFPLADETNAIEWAAG